MLVLDLSGFYVKFAQILATKADFVPEPWIRRLSWPLPPVWPKKEEDLIMDLVTPHRFPSAVMVLVGFVNLHQFSSPSSSGLDSMRHNDKGDF
ncbi:hypothetical protein Mapa_008583 [Marchantia paleacea]|nr:hypothetical protein Mapa_008583 [Marchantia paleacea]